MRRDIQIAPSPTKCSANNEVIAIGTESFDKAPPPIRTAFGWTFAGYVIYALGSWGMLSALTKLSTTVAVGQYVLGISIAVPVFAFSTLQLRTVHATDARSGYSFADYFTLRCLGIAAGFAMILAIVVLGHYDRDTSSVILLVAIAKSVECLGDSPAGLLQKAERLDQVARSLMMRGIVCVPVFAAALLAFHKLTLAVVAVAVAWAFVLVFYDLRIARKLLRGERFFGSNLSKLRQLAAVSLPLGVVIGLVALNGNIPRYVVLRHLGPAQLGIFVSLAYLITSVNLIVYALGQSVSARMARMFAVGDLKGFTHILKRLALLGALFGIVGAPAAILFGRPALRLLYRPEYAEYTKLLAIIAVVSGIGAVGLFLDFGMSAARCFRAQVPIIGLATLTAFVVAALLVPSRGLYGAAFGLLASSIVLAVGNGTVLSVAIRNARSAQRADHSVPDPTNLRSMDESRSSNLTYAPDHD
jgi:O-antigen/teichoic acid export membrane protein